jgi:hypothetical protein
LGPVARPIHRGSWRQTYSTWVQRHDPSTRCPQVGANMGHVQHSPSVTWALGCAQPQAGSPSATWVQWCGLHWGRTQAARVSFRQAAQAPRGRRVVPSTEAGPKRHTRGWVYPAPDISPNATCPYVIFLQ